MFVPGTHALTDDGLARACDIVFGNQPGVTQVVQHIPVRPARQVPNEIERSI
jgi:hypothetical protein